MLSYLNRDIFMCFIGSDWWEIILILDLFLFSSLLCLGILSLDLFREFSFFLCTLFFGNSLEQCFSVFQFIDLSVYLLNGGRSSNFYSFEKGFNIVGNTELFLNFRLFVLFVLFLMLFLRFLIIFALLGLNNLKSFFLFPLSISSQFRTDFCLIDLNFFLLFKFFITLLESIQVVN